MSITVVGFWILGFSCALFVYIQILHYVLYSSMQLNLTAGEEVEIEYEVDGWFYVSIHNWQVFGQLKAVNCLYLFFNVCIHKDLIDLALVFFGICISFHCTETYLHGCL